MSDFSVIQIQNPGILIGQIPADIFEKVKSNVESSKVVENNFSRNLMGQIEEEFKVELCSEMTSFLYRMWEEYRQVFSIKKKVPVHFRDSWVNFQKKHEYNPLHKHYGEAGWVTWINIPYNLADEDAVANSAGSRSNLNSRFQFCYTTLTGGIGNHTLHVDKSWEGTIIMFPQLLRHQVYPFFTNDGYRISLAGNVKQ